MSEQEIRALWSEAYSPNEWQDRIVAFARLVAAAEREACARICLRVACEAMGAGEIAAKECRDAIRKRGET